MKYFDESKIKPKHLNVIEQYDKEWQSYEGRADVKFVSKNEIADDSGLDPIVLDYVIDLVPVFAVVNEDFYKSGEGTKKALLEECGIPTENMLHGLLMSIESNGYDSNRMVKAYDDWIMFYRDADATNFSCIVCHLITKADSDNLFRLSKAFPEHVKVFVENQLLKDIPEEKIEAITNE